MKNVFFFLALFSFVFPLHAQETIPLFDEIPAFINNEPKKQPNTKNTPPPKLIEIKKEEKTSYTHKPNLGRDAEPITSIKLAPFPNISVDIDSSATPPKENKKFEEKVVSDDEIIRRSDPLTMTEKAESADEYFQRLINEKRLRIATRNSRYSNPLGLRHDADGFLISSVGLGMLSDEVIDILENQGYILSKTNYALPPALSAQYENDCRLTRKLYILSDIRACINDKAIENESNYIKQMVFERKKTRETIIVDYTSMATENVVYRISYKNKGDSSLNSSRKNRLIKENRKKEFWNLVFGIYGLPDNNEELLWGNRDTSFFTAQMTGSAYDAYLTLESSTLQNEDYFKLEESLDDEIKGGTFTFVSKEDVIEE